MTCGSDIAEPKEARCRAAKCPLAEAGDARCALCTGPVAWTDGMGARRGRARSCHGCPMDGLGLPVCWAACPGPNDGFQADGQSVVCLGAMDGQEGADAFVGRFAADAQERADGAFGSAERGFAAGLMRLDSRGWEEMKAAVASMDARSAARIAGVPLGMFRGPRGKWEGSVADRVMSRVGQVDGATWEQVRGVLSGRSQSEVARLGLVTKQAVSKRLIRAARRLEWLARLLG